MAEQKQKDRKQVNVVRLDPEVYAKLIKIVGAEMARTGKKQSVSDVIGLLLK